MTSLRKHEHHVLDRIKALWDEATALESEADDFETFMKEKRYEAQDKEQEAEDLSKGLIEEHPEWRDDLLFNLIDPRTREGSDE